MYEGKAVSRRISLSIFVKRLFAFPDDTDLCGNASNNLFGTTDDGFFLRKSNSSGGAKVLLMDVL